MTETQQAWFADPYRRYKYRWYDGSRWTEHVAARGVVSVDPIPIDVSTSDARSSSVPKPSQKPTKSTTNEAAYQVPGSRSLATPKPVPTQDRPDQSPLELFAKLRGRVQRAVKQNLDGNEHIRTVIRGSNGQAIIGTDRRAIMCKPGFMAGATLGAEVSSYGYLNISGVQLHEGMVSGTVAIEVGMPMMRTTTWGQGDRDTYKAPNAIPVQARSAEVRAGVAVLRHLIDEAHSGLLSPTPTPSMTRERLPNPTPTAVASSTIPALLQQLGDLHRSGVLSDEEFRAAKARLLE